VESDLNLQPFRKGLLCPAVPILTLIFLRADFFSIDEDDTLPLDCSFYQAIWCRITGDDILYNVFSLLGELEKLRKAAVSFVMPACPSICPSARPSRGILMKFGFCVFFENLSRKYKLH
jgi:hypothetical protein